MRELLILRHAKSSWKEVDLDDHDRPLKKRGLRDAPRMGKLLRDQSIVPDVILSSTAVRARSTAELTAKACAFDGPLRLERALYLAGPDQYLEWLSALADDCRRAMVVGHNPGLEELLELLTGTDEALPTAALARLLLPIEDWAQLTRSSRGQLAGLWLPREL